MNGKMNYSFHSDISLSPMMERFFSECFVRNIRVNVVFPLGNEIGIHLYTFVHFMLPFPFRHPIQANRTESCRCLQSTTLTADETTRVLLLRTGYLPSFLNLEHENYSWNAWSVDRYLFRSRYPVPILVRVFPVRRAVPTTEANECLCVRYEACVDAYGSLL